MITMHTCPVHEIGSVDNHSSDRTAHLFYAFQRLSNTPVQVSPLSPIPPSSHVAPRLLVFTSAHPLFPLPAHGCCNASKHASPQFHRLADDQASHQTHAQELLDLQQSLEPDVVVRADERTPGDDECSSSEDELEEKENTYHSHRRWRVSAPDAVRK